MVEQVSPVDYKIQFSPDGKKKTIHCEELQFDTCDQEIPNRVKDELDHQARDNLSSSSNVRPAQTLPRLTKIDQDLLDVKRCTGPYCVVANMLSKQTRFKNRVCFTKLNDKPKTLVSSTLCRSIVDFLLILKLTFVIF